MTKLNNKGQSHPLTSAMASPLDGPLTTVPRFQRRKAWARSSLASLVLGVAALSASQTLAGPSPEKSLADTVVTSNSGKTVLKMNKVDDNGDKISKHYEIERKGDEFDVYEFDETGKKTKVKMSDIEGFEAERAKNSKSWSFSIGDDNTLKFVPGKDHAKGAERLLHLKNGAEHSSQLRVLENGKVLHIKKLESLKDLENLKGLESLANLEALKNLEGLEVLEDLEGLEELDEAERLEILNKLKGMKIVKRVELDGDEGRKVFTWTGDMPEPPLPPGIQMTDDDVVISRSYAFSDNKNFEDNPVIEFKSGQNESYFILENDEARVESQLAAARSMLESVENMLRDVKESGESEDTKDDLRKVRRELKRARKNLKDVETRLHEDKTTE